MGKYAAAKALFPKGIHKVGQGKGRWAKGGHHRKEVNNGLGGGRCDYIGGDWDPEKERNERPGHFCGCAYGLDKNFKFWLCSDGCKSIYESSHVEKAGCCTQSQCHSKGVATARQGNPKFKHATSTKQCMICLCHNAVNRGSDYDVASSDEFGGHGNSSQSRMLAILQVCKPGTTAKQ